MSNNQEIMVGYNIFYVDLMLCDMMLICMMLWDMILCNFILSDLIEYDIIFLFTIVLRSGNSKYARKSQHYDYLHHTCLSNVDNCSDSSGVFQYFNGAVITARNDRSHYHARDNKPVAYYMI